MASTQGPPQATFLLRGCERGHTVTLGSRSQIAAWIYRAWLATSADSVLYPRMRAGTQRLSATSRIECSSPFLSESTSVCGEASGVDDDGSEDSGGMVMWHKTSVCAGEK